MNITVAFACLVIIMVLIKFVDNKKNKRLYELLRQFPSYPTLPLIGNVHLLFGWFDDLLKRGEELVQPYDRLVFWIGPIPCIVLKKYDDIVTILNQSLDRETLHAADEWAGIGLLTARYDEWKKSRRILAPAFSSEMLSKYVEVFNNKASNLVEKLKSVADTDEEVDVLDYATNATLNAIIVSLSNKSYGGKFAVVVTLGTFFLILGIQNTMGISIENTGKSGEEFCNALLEGFLSVTKRTLTPWLHPHYVYMMYLKFTGKIESIKRLKYLPNKILKDNLNDIHNHNYVLDDVGSSKTVIDQLIKGYLKEPNSFSETRVRDELLHIILAGVETTALNLSYLMLMMAIHQDIQQKVYEEISQLLEDDEPITHDHLCNHLKYLEQCIRETTRMFSPVTLTSRRTHKDCLLKDNTIVPANSIVVTLIHFTNYDPTLYKNPQKWDPEHFSDQAVAERPKGSNQLSFGFGPRSCIGARYAMMSVKTQISYILRNYHLSTHLTEFTKDNLKMDLMIRNKIGYPIKFSSRRKLKL